MVGFCVGTVYCWVLAIFYSTLHTVRPKLIDFLMKSKATHPTIKQNIGQCRVGKIVCVSFCRNDWLLSRKVMLVIGIVTTVWWSVRTVRWRERRQEIHASKRHFFLINVIKKPISSSGRDEKKKRAWTLKFVLVFHPELDPSSSGRENCEITGPHGARARARGWGLSLVLVFGAPWGPA